MIEQIGNRISRIAANFAVTVWMIFVILFVAGCTGGVDTVENTAASPPPPTSPPPLPSLSVSDASIAEGDAGDTILSFSVTLSAASSDEVTVDYSSVDGTATSPGDFEAVGGILSFAPGSTTQTIDVTVHGDSLDEPDETLTVNLFSPSNATISTSTATGTISDDDGPPQLPSLTISNAFVTEGDSGDTTLSFNVSLSAAASNVVTVNYASADGSATAPGDFDAASGTLSFPIGTTDQTISVVVHGDTLTESDETLAVTLSTPTNALITLGTATGTIIDDDAPPPLPVLSISNASTIEGDIGDTILTFSVTLSAASSGVVTVNYASADGTAGSPVDYTPAAGTLSFPVGTTTQTISVVVHGDSLDESDETFIVGLAAPGGAVIGVASAVGTIIDDDVPLPTVSVSSAIVIEGDAGDTTLSFNVSLSAAAPSIVTVDYASADGSAIAPGDYDAVSGALSFPIGTTNQTISVIVHGDTDDETDETLTLTLSSSVNATIGTGSAVGTINNDDTPLPTISISGASVTEGDIGNVSLSFNVSLSAAAASVVTVDYASADGTATSPGDYDATTGTLTFPIGTTNQTIIIAVHGDTDDEPDESLTVTLSSPSNATLAGATATGTINNDDTPTPSLSISSASVTEGDAGDVTLSFDVALSAAASNVVTVDYASVDGTATSPDDYDAVSGTLSFPVGSTNQTINVAVHGDIDDESNEILTVTLSAPGNATISTASATGLILDDDDPLPAISISGASVTEGDAGDVILSFNVALSAVSSDVVTVDYASTDGTAISPGDYDSVNGTLSFPVGTTNQTVTVAVHGDTDDEPDENLTVTLSSPTNATLATATATGTINNDDTPTPSLSISSASVTEGDAGDVTLSFNVSLSAAASSVVTVDYASSDGTATTPDDYAAVSGTLSFPIGTTNQTISVAVHGDTDDEPDETLTVSLASPTNATIATGTATGTINNDDTPQPTLSISNANVTEGDTSDVTLSFDVTLSTAASSVVTVDYLSADVTATSPDDYAAVSGTLSFPIGTTNQTISVAVHGDTDDEPDETLTVSLASPTNATIATGTATGTINNDDTPQPTLSISNANVTEGDTSDVTLSFDVTLSTAASSVVTVDYLSADVTATSPDDYDAVSGTLSFPVGTTNQTVSVAVHGDTDDEPDEALTVSLASPTNATIATGTATGTINNDDTPQPTLSISNANVTEGDTGDVTLSFDVALSATASSVVTVDYSSADATATSPDDYDAVSGTLNFPVGTTNQTVAVAVHGDTDDEPDETLAVTLASPTNATIATGTGTGTIVNDDGSVIFGLDTRPDNQTCVAPPRPTADASVSVVDPFPSLPALNQPTKILLEPVANPRWFVLQKPGELVTFDPNDATALDPYLSLSGVRTVSEGGLLGMAFHPNYPNTPEVFLFYTTNHSGPAMRSVISRFILDSVSDPGPGTVEQVIFQVDQEQNHHNGGDIAFGPDGYLYVGLGDDATTGDPNNRAQNTTKLVGSVLRIDVDGPGVSSPTNPYDIPTDNPFVGNAKCGPGSNANACPEIYAWGFRNPWRWSFDPDTEVLWLADVGNFNWEEVNTVERGGNYGWHCREGAHDTGSSDCGTGLIDPVSDYSHSVGNSITGGYVYRGSAIPGLIGRYVFADYGSGRIWALQSDGQGGYTNDQLIDTNFGPTSFGVDENGELLFTDINSGRIRMIMPAGAPVPDTIPTLLSDTGCTDPVDITNPYAGLLPYDINALFWSDGAAKERFIGLPNGTTITRNANDDWDFPNGTVIVKNFRLQGNLIETRHLMRHPNGVWAGYTYEWNGSQTEATRVQGGKTVNIGGQDWIYPSEGQCMQCHTSAAGFALGPETAQLNSDFTYPSMSRTANQLETLDHVMMFTTPLSGPASGLPALTNPQNTNASLSDRARAYLHTNCAQCHRPGGPTQSAMDLRYTTSLANTNACDATPLLGNLGISNARIISPGDPGRSVMIERTSRRDSHGMPPVGSNLIDTVGVSLLTNWVNSLANCN